MLAAMSVPPPYRAGLAALCAVALGASAPAARRAEPFAPFVEPGFPFIVSTVDAGKLGPAFPTRNLAVRCVLLMLGNDAYACFDTDLLRVAAAWRGGFVSLTTMAQVSYQQPGNKNNAIPRVLGRGVVATGVYPGWSTGEPDLRDPRPPGPNPDAVGRGPIAEPLGRWSGVRVVGKEAVLAYTVAGADVREQISSVAAGSQVAIARTFALDVTPAKAEANAKQQLTLVLGEVDDGSASEVRGDTAVVLEGASRDTVTVVGLTGAPAGARLAVDAT